MAVSGWLHWTAKTQDLSAWPLEQRATHTVYIGNIGLADHSVILYSCINYRVI